MKIENYKDPPMKLMDLPAPIFQQEYMNSWIVPKHKDLLPMQIEDDDVPVFEPEYMSNYMLTRASQETERKPIQELTKYRQNNAQPIYGQRGNDYMEAVQSAMLEAARQQAERVAAERRRADAMMYQEHRIPVTYQPSAPKISKKEHQVDIQGVNSERNIEI